MSDSRLPSSLVPPIVGCVFGVVCGVMCGGVGQWWLFRGEARDDREPLEPVPAAISSTDRRRADRARPFDEPVPPLARPESTGEWMDLIEPLDPEATAERLAGALEAFDSDELAALCETWLDALDPDVVSSALLVAALAKRAAALDLERFLDLAFGGTGGLRTALRARLVSHQASHDLAAAASVFDRPLTATERQHMWVTLATAETSRPFASLWSELGVIFDRYATPEEQSKGLEVSLGLGGAGILATRYPDEVRSWLDDRLKRLGAAAMDPQETQSWPLEEGRFWRNVNSFVDAAIRRAGVVDDDPPTRLEIADRQIHGADAIRMHAENDPLGYADELRTLGLETDTQKRAHTFFTHWADRDGKAAAEWLSRHRDFTLSPETAMTVTRALANVDPAALPRLLETFDAKVRAEALLHAAPQLGRLDASVAAAAVFSLADRDQQISSLNAITESVAARGASDALAWVRALPTDFQAQAVGGVLNTLAVQEPALAAEAATVWIESGRAVPELPIVSLAREWATGAPEAAASWADSLPPGPPQDQASRTIALAWAAHDADAAREWIDAWPDSQVKVDCQRLIPLQ